MLAVENLSKVFQARKSWFEPAQSFAALRNVSFHVDRGESFGLVGESGSGKTTLTRCILRLDEPSEGHVLFEGQDLAKLNPRDMRRLRSKIQIVFQDPYASLNPRMSVHDIVTEPMTVHQDILGLNSRARTNKAVELLSLVGLGSQHLHRYPHEFSGGQRQRIGIARALSTDPELLLLDEPTSALDVSVQAQVLNLLHELQKRLNLTYFFISHDLAVIRYICDRVALIYRGEIVEEGETETVFDTPSSDYARRLIAAMPDAALA
jgi:ABC-type oligopeptide transport system ATPase subunit